MTGWAVGRPVRGRCRSDDGSALVEFCVLSVVLLVPVVYLVVTLGRLQAASFAVQGAAREAARAFVTAPDEASGRERADAAVRIALADQGFTDPASAGLELVCGAGGCLAPDSRVSVHTTLDVVLPAVPRFLDRALPARIQVDASHVAVVDRFGGGR